MDVVFYDRKNKREVSNEQLCHINIVRCFAAIDEDDTFVPTGRRLTPMGEPVTREEYTEGVAKGWYETIPAWNQLKVEKTPMVIHSVDEVVSDIGYKSENCPEYQNWDLHCLANDLVFLRFE